MSVTVKDGVLRISVGYAAKVGLANFSSHDSHRSLSFEQEVEGGDLAQILSEAEKVEAMLEGYVKLSVAQSLGLEMKGTELQFPDTPPAKVKAPSAPARQTPRSHGGSSRLQDMEIVTIDGVDFYDQRPLKADGSYSPKAPDFKEAGKARGGQSLWIRSQDGSVNSEVVEKLKAAGVELLTVV